MPYGKRHTSRIKPVSPKHRISKESLYSPQYILYYQHITEKYALFSLHPAKPFLYFGHSADPNQHNYVAELVLYGAGGSVRDLNRWEYEW